MQKKVSQQCSNAEDQEKGLHKGQMVRVASFTTDAQLSTLLLTSTQTRLHSRTEPQVFPKFNAFEYLLVKNTQFERILSQDNEPIFPANTSAHKLGVNAIYRSLHSQRYLKRSSAI